MSNRPPHDARHPLSRRAFLGRAGLGLGLAGLGLLDPSVLAGVAANGVLPGAMPGPLDAGLTPRPPGEPLLARAPHFAAKARRVIVLHMAGSPSQLDLFEPKPVLSSLDGQDCPDSLLEGRRFAFINGKPRLLASPYSFAQHGQSGAWVSELLPHFASIVDDVALVRSMHTEEFNHAPAQLFMQTGFARIGRPTMGAWVTYGLGTENRDLPGFVVLVSGGKTPSAGKSVWGSGFLPSVYQGVQCRSRGDPVLYLSDPPGMDRPMRRDALDVLQQLNARQLERDGDPETSTRITQYELAYRMQTSVPEVMDIGDEPAEVHELYGTQPGEVSFANNCLLARRLVERGTRFVQLYDWGWDHHGSSAIDDLPTHLPRKCREIDRPMTALVLDLKRRGLLDDTLIVWGGEFGRTPMRENRNNDGFTGRDHHPGAFTIWMAGGGVRGGQVLGATDDFGYEITRDPTHVHDLQATILHLLGLDHERLTWMHQGRDFRLTDVAGRVIEPLLA